MALQVNIHEAKTHLSQLLNQVRQGEEIIIARDGIPVARLIPMENQLTRRAPGTARGKIVISADFDAPLPESCLGEFEMGEFER